MKRIAIMAIMISALLVSLVHAEDKPKDANLLFYKANTLYEKGEYLKATELYLNILDMGFEGGSLYYNIGNAFLKLGRTGYAILSYKKAERFMPQDSDLRANLNYARSLTGSQELPPENFITKLIKRPFKGYNLDMMTILVAFLYIIVILISAVFIVNPIFAKKMRVPFLIIFIAFLISTSTFGMKFYKEVMLKHGIVVQKDVEARYEPIDKSTVYYKLHEGNEVVILETRNDWRRIKRPDGKIAWLNKGAVEEI